MTQYHTWSQLKAPDDWKQAEIPQAAGHYQLAAVDANGELVTVPHAPAGNQPAETVEQLEQGRVAYKGVLYIGKASNLHERFWHLVESWLTNTQPPSNPHESRKKWNKDPALQNQYPVGQMRCRFLAEGKVKSGQRLEGAAEEYHNIIWGPDDDARRTGQPTPAALVSLEASELMKYETCMGHLPPLNTKPADRPADVPPRLTVEEDSHEIRLADDAIEMGDPESEDVKRTIEEYRKRNSAG
jgi:hypothetical protein